MKLLIYGIDGADLEIFQIFKDQMPFTSKYIKENTCIDLEEDLINRGWVEILTGKTGEETKGFYMSPKLDGTVKFSTSFKMSDLRSSEKVVPLWELANELGVSCGIMNVPTTTPAPKIKNGFLVGSAGGGLNKIDGIPDLLVSNKELVSFLENRNYIVDIRIPNDEIEFTEDLFEAVLKKELKRTEVFIELVKDYQVDFGFLVNRGNTIVSYLARREMELLKENPGHKSWVVECLREHFYNLDQQIESLFSNLNPEHFIITSDHGIVPSKRWANINVFLKEHKFLVDDNAANYILSLKKIVKRWIGLSKKNMPGKFVKRIKRISQYDMNKTKAFGSTYIPGIFINDERFGGPVRTNADRLVVIKQLIEKFNNLPDSIKGDFYAEEYRDKFSGSAFYNYLPDIKIQNSEGVFFDETGAELIWDNPNYGEIPKALSEVNHAAFTGDKGKNPLCVLDSETAKLVREDDEKNLTLIYKLTKRILEGDSKN